MKPESQLRIPLVPLHHHLPSDLNRTCRLQSMLWFCCFGSTLSHQFMSCISVLLCVQTSSFSVFIYKTLGFSLGSRSEHSSLLWFLYFLLMIFFHREKKKNLPSLCVFSVVVSRRCRFSFLSHIFSFFFFYWK